MFWWVSFLILANANPSFQAIPEEISLPEAKPRAENPQDGTVISATVRLIRSNPQTEVFFVDRKESLIIPANSNHNRIFEACLQSSLKRTPVSLQIDPKTRSILSAPSKTSGSVESRTEGKSQNESSSGSN